MEGWVFKMEKQLIINNETAGEIKKEQEEEQGEADEGVGWFCVAKAVESIP